MVKTHLTPVSPKCLFTPTTIIRTKKVISHDKFYDNFYRKVLI